MCSVVTEQTTWSLRCHTVCWRGDVGVYDACAARYARACSLSRAHTYVRCFIDVFAYGSVDLASGVCVCVRLYERVRFALGLPAENKQSLDGRLCVCVCVCLCNE